ncbi:general secretion pathway protein GspB [Chiayiivirga flava]|uniref:General secretion pathway protein B n=1 Tax=Chiayiivirga flava TaxID=659595 RepID=A0A7W8G0K2_9GAMM|nr:general secretion pathway protein GspB [Chiayiivirga flava]MBB5209587.1 general secretion pathway protein B [Chiayiivirga flava]
MSLILEALKKSEAERRLGQVPGLMTPVQRTATRRRPTWPLLLALLVLLALAAALAWWWLRGAPSAPEPAAAPAPSAAAPAPAARDAAPTPTTPTTPARATAPPPQTAELPSDPDFVSTERESRPVPANSAPPVDPAPAASRPAAPAPAPPVATAPPVAAPPAPAIPAVPDEPLDMLPRLVDLSAAERDALPPLKLTMHVYAADPAARFVLIDGQRLREGDRLSRALAVSEIRRDGAVLEFDGRRFLIPRL